MVYPIPLSVWSDHGNFIATAYTGTGALRTDFTRTGVRTRKGVVFDKLTSGWRYILNNHSDGYKQVNGFWRVVVTEYGHRLIRSDSHLRMHSI